MARKIYVGVNNVAKEVSDVYVGVNGTARRVIKGYVGVNDVAEKFYDFTEKTILPRTWTASTSTSWTGQNSHGTWEIQGSTVPYDGYELKYAFDGDEQTSYEPMVRAGISGWAKLIAPSGKSVLPEYFYLKGNSGTGTWTLTGSNDGGTTEDVLFSGSGFVNQVFQYTGAQAYKEFKFTIEPNRSARPLFFELNIITGSVISD